MSTRCRIGILEKDGTVTSIYCHSDGYVGFSGVGAMLYRFYNSEERIRKLLALGDMSTLGIDPEDCPHLWNPNYTDGWNAGYMYGLDSAWNCKTYKGRGDQNVGAMKHENIDEYINYDRVMIEYVYLYKDKKWYVSGHFSNKPKWNLLATVIKKEQGK